MYHILDGAVCNSPENRKQKNPGIADFEVDGKVISDGGLKSEILNSQFSSVFTKEDLENFPEIGSDPTPGLRSLIISEQGVLNSCLR